MLIVKKSNQFKTQLGSTLIGALGLLLSAVIGALCLDFVLNLIPVTNKIVIPWAIVSLFLFPFAYCVQTIHKLWELKEPSGLSKTEKRRLSYLISGKNRQLLFAAAFYIFSAVIAVVLFTLSSGNPAYFRSSVIILGGLLGVSIFSLALIYLEIKQINDFKVKLMQRVEDKKRRKAALKKLAQ